MFTRKFEVYQSALPASVVDFGLNPSHSEWRSVPRKCVDDVDKDKRTAKRYIAWPQDFVTTQANLRNITKPNSE
ncbi:jg5894 [Pararge aegeria aegeria]|uniref:Jg5894 protein n=1 Tax=Pararge aegeria aegeria TaxID=348720 RepID=A0A8S4REM7_9NEOP|nr:jg5894 [Pararge aegeria aegeria]